MNTVFRIALFLGALFLGALSAGGTIPLVAQENSAGVEIVRRFNLTLRQDGRYAGHQQREVRLWLVASVDPGAYEGEILVSENTIRDLRTVASLMESRDAITMVHDGERLVQRSGVPVWQGIPTIPRGLAGGAAGAAGAANAENREWQAPAVIRVQLPDRSVAGIPTVVAYRLEGVETYRGEQSVRIEFGYRLQWPQSETQLEEHPAAEMFRWADLPAEGFTLRANHQGTIIIPVGGGVPSLHRTNVEELITAPDGTKTERRGFFLTWYRNVPHTDGITDDLVDRLQSLRVPEVDVGRDELNRVRLSIRNLQFVADEARLLAGETHRLDRIAELLQTVPEATVLVTGHTADIGSAESQVSLSVQRAKTIVDALIERGLAPGRFRYEGKGGTQPVGDNTTEEGRAANRRVEIRLLGE
ncbi:MAG: OmpA family protein [Spirochaetaceae bacterium]|nr:MAG: OmpA family protein [Spirochaetaceae bacterium]